MQRPDIFTMPEHLRPFAREVQVNGMRLHCYDAGSGGTPMILIHGLADEADTWRHVFLPLAQKQRVIALDLPGFGRSDRPRRAYTLAFYAQTVAGLIEALGLQRATLIGSSLGGATAQRLALARPHLVEQLALIGGGLPTTAGLPPAALWIFLTPGVGEGAYTGLRASQDQAYETLRPYYRDLDALPEEDRAFLRERVWARVWSDGQRRAFLSTLRWLSIERALRAPDFYARLPHLHTPTHLIWGEQDVISPPAAGAALAALLPDATLTRIPECGHLPQQECPAKLLAALEDRR